MVRIILVWHAGHGVKSVVIFIEVLLPYGR